MTLTSSLEIKVKCISPVLNLEMTDQIKISGCHREQFPGVDCVTELKKRTKYQTLTVGFL